jgi:hypothetical protein
VAQKCLCLSYPLFVLSAVCPIQLILQTVWLVERCGKVSFVPFKVGVLGVLRYPNGSAEVRIAFYRSHVE